MKTGIILLCRFNSSRLPGKILKTIQGKPLIQYITERLEKVVEKDKIVIATSTAKEDDVICNWCNENGFNFFRGDLNNVAQRFYDCAVKSDFDYAVRINGDNIFAEFYTISEMMKIAEENSYDFLTNVQGKTFPQGMSVEIVNTGFYGNALKKFTNEKHFEHVTLYFYEHPEVGSICFHYNTVCPEAVNLKFAVDDQKDFELAEKIISKMNNPQTDYGMKEIVQLYNEITNEQLAR